LLAKHQKLGGKERFPYMLQRKNDWVDNCFGLIASRIETINSVVLTQLIALCYRDRNLI
jgi:hypothetical protein